MFRLAARALVLLVLATALAGCVDSPAAETTTGTPPVVVTSPDDYAYLGDNASKSDVAHLHDYWDGKDRLVVMDVTDRRGTVFMSDYRIFEFRPAAGQVVPQGAESVEITISWTGSPTDRYGAPELWVKTAEDAEAFQVGVIAPGEPAVIASTNEKNDLPHQSLSAWVIEFRVPPADEVTPITFQGEVTVLMEAVRGIEIPLYPAHPDRWNGTVEKELLRDTIGLFAYRDDPVMGRSCFFWCLEPHAPADGAIVPQDAAVVEVVIESDPKEPTRLGLRFHAADTWELTELAPDEDDPGRRVYRIPVGRTMGDGPYALQSLWEFQPFVDTTLPIAAHASTGFTLTATVKKTA